MLSIVEHLFSTFLVVRVKPYWKISISSVQSLGYATVM
jgi:hypothetical protein